MFCLLSCNRAKQKPIAKDKEIFSNLKNNDTGIKELAEKEGIIAKYLVDSGMQSVNDSVRWHLYNIYCEYLLPSALRDTSKRIALSYLDLKPLFLETSNDKQTIEIIYSFIYKGKQVSNFIVPPDAPIAKGVKVNIRTKKIIAYLSGGGGYFTVKENTNGNDATQPTSHISFLLKNKTDLNLWYKEALLRHGIKL